METAGFLSKNPAVPSFSAVAFLLLLTARRVLAPRERVTPRRIARVETTLEPALALRARAVRERFRVHAAPRLAEDAIVAHGRGSLKSLLHVARIELAALLRTVAPHAGVAVGLQLQTHGILVGVRRVTLLRAPYFGLRAEQLLHVMPQLMRDHIALCEVARRTELVAQLVEEAEIEIDLLVHGTIEGTHRRLAGAAAGGRVVAEEYQLGVRVLRAVLRKDLRPRLLHVVQHTRHDQHFRLLGGRVGGAQRAVGGCHGARGRGARVVEHVRAEEQVENERHHTSASAQARASE